MLTKFYTHWIKSFSGIPRGVWLLSLVNFINRCGSMVLIFLSVYLTTHLGFDIRDAGYVMTCFGLGAIVGMGIGGWATDKFGYYPIQMASLILNGLMLLLLLLVSNFWWMCMTIFTLSLVSEVFRPANQVAIGYYSTPENRTRSVSLLRMAFNLGFTISPALGGILAGHFGWHWLFWADGLTCIGAAIALRFLLKPGKVAHAETAAPGENPPTIQPPYHDKPYLVFTLLTFVGALVFMQIMWTVPLYFKDGFHWTEDQIGWAMTLNGAIVFLVEMPLIFYVEGRRPILSFVRIGLGLYFISYLMFMLPLAGIAAAVLYMLFISLGEIMVMPFSSNFAYAKAAEQKNKGQYMAMYGLAYSVANILAPLLGTQIIAAWGFYTLWSITLGLSVVAIAGFFWLDQRLTNSYSVQPGI